MADRDGSLGPLFFCALNCRLGLVAPWPTSVLLAELSADATRPLGMLRRAAHHLGNKNEAARWPPRKYAQRPVRGALTHQVAGGNSSLCARGNLSPEGIFAVQLVRPNQKTSQASRNAQAESRVRQVRTLTLVVAPRSHSIGRPLSRICGIATCPRPPERLCPSEVGSVATYGGKNLALWGQNLNFWCHPYLSRISSRRN
jgi:hypothetical protein